VERLAYIAGFAVSGYSGTQRYKPDFNPLLGETYEYIDQRSNTILFSEQVSHHPPISALHSSNADNWVFWQNSSPTTKFLGNYIDLDTQAKSHVLFPKTGEHYFYTTPSTRIHNVIFGSMWIEHFGTLSIKSLDGSYTCTIIFKKSGLFQGTQYKVEGHIEDKNGKKLVKLEGRWDECLEGKWLEDTAFIQKGETRKLWLITSDTIVRDLHNFTQYTKSLNDFDKDMESILPPTDSRRRLDRYFLEKGETDSATFWKKAMEERQRHDRKTRKETWQPLWFKKVEQNDSLGEGKSMWVYCGDYWEQRSRKVERLKEGKDVSALLRPSQVLGLACDYTSYSPSLSTPTTDSDTTLEQDTITDTTADTNTDTATITATDEEPKDDDTDTETELEAWSPAANGTTTMGTGELQGDTEVVKVEEGMQRMQVV